MNRLSKLWYLYLTCFLLTCCQTDKAHDNSIYSESSTSSIYNEAAETYKSLDPIEPDLTSNTSSIPALPSFINPNKCFDFDLDGYDEYYSIEYGQITEIQIYKQIGLDWVNWGDTIKVNCIKKEWLDFQDIVLFYDEDENEFFYVSEYDVWEKEYNYADINEYHITNDGLVERNFAHVEFDYISKPGYIDFYTTMINGHEIESMGLVFVDDVRNYFIEVDGYFGKLKQVSLIHVDNDGYLHEIKN